MTDDAAVDAPFAEVVVPLDGSPEAERALGPALELVRRTAVPLRLISRVLEGEEEARAEYLAGLSDRHAAVSDVETQIVRRDAIPDAILEAMGPGSLVCLSSHGRSGLSRAVMGSVAEALLRSTVQPALVVGPQVTESAPAFEGRVVACIDGSEASQRTLAPARRWSMALGLPLWLVEVGEPTVRPAEWATGGDVHEGGGLASLAGRTEGVAAWETLHDRRPATALVDLASSSSDPVALLVMATHGRTGWDRLRLGSVTSAVVHRSTVPVLVVPASPASEA